MIGALLIAASAAAAPAAVAGCPIAQSLLSRAPADQPSHDLARSLSAPLATDLHRLPSLQAALDDLDGARPGMATTEARRDVEETLAAVCARSMLPTNPAPIDPAVLATILRQPQFDRRNGDGPQLGTVLERLWDVIKDALYSEGFSRYAIYSRELFLLVVVVMATWLAFQVRRPRAPEEAPLPAARSQPIADPASEELVHAARAARERGELAAAVALEMAAVRRAARRGAVDAGARARTDREWLRALAAEAEHAERVPALAALVSAFERLFYGAPAPTDADVGAFHAQAEAVRAHWSAGS